MGPPLGETSSNIHSNIEHERILPLREMATFCRYAWTRYAFIMTQTELVALRIRRLPRRPREKTHYAGVEYVSVPWDASTGLTFNLAIWALGCMGMNDAHREMEAPVPVKNTALESMVRLTWWKYDAQNKVYENVISKRRIPEDEWQELDTSFVQLDEQSGNSFTSKFVSPDSPRAFGQYTTWAPGGIDPLNLGS